MHDTTSSSCAEMMPNMGDTTTLEDERDHKNYSIVKLPDGRYWVTTNLDLAVGTMLNASDSNVPSDGYYTVPDNSSFDGTDTGFAKNTGSTDCTNTNTGCYSYYSCVAATVGGKDASGNSITTDGGKAAYSIVRMVGDYLLLRPMVLPVIVVDILVVTSTT